MAQYHKKVKRATGGLSFYRDGKRISRGDLPTSIKKILKTNLNAEDDLQPPYPPTKTELRKIRDAELAEAAKVAPPPVKQCIFDGKETKIHRVVNGETVYICDEHYYAKSLGQLAQGLREFRNGKGFSNEKQEAGQEAR